MYLWINLIFYKLSELYLLHFWVQHEQQQVHLSRSVQTGNSSRCQCRGMAWSRVCGLCHTAPFICQTLSFENNEQWRVWKTKSIKNIYARELSLNTSIHSYNEIGILIKSLSCKIMILWLFLALQTKIIGLISAGSPSVTRKPFSLTMTLF